MRSSERPRNAFFLLVQPFVSTNIASLVRKVGGGDGGDDDGDGMAFYGGSAYEAIFCLAAAQCISNPSKAYLGWLAG